MAKLVLIFEFRGAKRKVEGEFFDLKKIVCILFFHLDFGLIFQRSKVENRKRKSN